jgi:uncharacterized membrane protein YqjE
MVTSIHDRAVSHAAGHNRGVSEVLHDIFCNLQDIVRSEMRLVKTEVAEGLARSSSPAIWVAIGVIIGCLALFFVMLAAVFALSVVVPNWAAALIVALGLAVFCAIAVASGTRRLKQVRLAPLTLASSKENVSWSKQQPN